MTDTALNQIEQLEKTIEEKQKKAEKVERNIRNARVRAPFVLFCVVLIFVCCAGKLATSPGEVGNKHRREVLCFI